MMLRSSQPSPLIELITLILCLGLSLLMLGLPDDLQILMADRIGSVLTEPYWRVRNFGEDVLRLRRDKAWLQAHMMELELQRAAQQRIQPEWHTRERLHQLWPDFADRLRACEVVARQVSRRGTMIKIRSAEPIAWRLYQPVLTPAGLIGRLRQVVASDAAWVELLTAPDMALGCEVERTGLVGILRPFGSEFLLDMIGRDETGVVVSDLVITSGIAEVDEADRAGHWGLMPRGLPVGRVEQIEQIAGSLFLEIRVEPLADFYRNESVFVVEIEAAGAAGPTNGQRP
jgi:hypothetical protein